MEASGKRYILYGKFSEEIKIWNLADLHWLSAACAEKEIAKDIAEILNDPCSFWLGGGDYCDFIGYTDNRFDPDCVHKDIKVSDLGKLGDIGYGKIREMFTPIKHKCLGLLLGNHEKTYEKHEQQQDRSIKLCLDLGVPDLRYSALFDLVLVRQSGAGKPKLVKKVPPNLHRETFRVFCHHGCGFATTPGGKMNKLIQFMNSFDADVYFCGHVHDKIGRRQPAIGANKACTKLVARDRLGVISGSYLKTYKQGATTYGEQRGYTPVSLGAAFVKIKPETRELTGEI